MNRWLYLFALVGSGLPVGTAHGVVPDPSGIDSEVYCWDETPPRVRLRDRVDGTEFLADDARKPLPPAKGDESLFQGEWQVESAQKRGKPHQRLVGDRLSFEESKLAIRPKSGDNTEGQFRIRPDTTPKEIDLTILIGDDAETLKGIYQFSDGKLHITFSPSGVARPKGFDTKEGEEQIGMVLKKTGAKKE